MEAAPLETVIHLGEDALSSNGLDAWNRRIGEIVLTLKASITSLMSTVSGPAGVGEMPALAITMSSCVIPAASISLTAFWGSVSEVLSMLTRSSREPVAVGRSFSAWALAALLSRTLPMTV